MSDEEIEREEVDNRTFFVTQPTEERKSGKKPDKDAPIDNALDIPLFEDADKRGIRTATYIKIIKLDEPNSGYKGNIPLTSTLDTIGKLFGNGYYNIIACNHRHQELRSKENVKIDIPIGRTALITDTVDKDDKSIMSSDLIRELSNKAIELASMGAIEAKAQNREYTELVRSTMEKASERDRIFMEGQTKNTEAFFGNLMLAQNQMFQQTMALLTAGHQMTIQVLTSEKSKQKDPIELLLAGMQLAKEMGNGNDDDSPDWLKALKSGENMLTKLSLLKAENNGTNNGNQGGNQGSNQGGSNTSIQTAPPKQKIPLTKQEVLEVVELKKLLRSRGIDLSALVRQATETYKEPDEEEESSDNAEESSQSSSEEPESATT